MEDDGRTVFPNQNRANRRRIRPRTRTRIVHELQQEFYWNSPNFWSQSYKFSLTSSNYKHWLTDFSCWHFLSQIITNKIQKTCIFILIYWLRYKRFESISRENLQKNSLYKHTKYLYITAISYNDFKNLPQCIWLK